MCAKLFLHCSIKKVVTPSDLFFYRFPFLDQSSITMATMLYHIFLKSSLLFEIFLVEGKKKYFERICFSWFLGEYIAQR